MNTSELLIKAKALIDTPEKWTKRYYARNSENIPVMAESLDATCFCSYGALQRIAITQSIHHRSNSFRNAHRLLAFEAYTDAMCLTEYNDAHSHEEVMALWDRAIANAQQGEV